MTNILTSITELTLGMSAVITLLLVLLMWKGKTLKAKSRYIIWALVILRLAVPFSLGLMPSLFTLPALPVTEVTLPSAQDNSEGSTSADTAPQYSVALPTPGTENVLQQSPDVTDSVSTSPLIPDEGNVVQGNNSVIPNAPSEEKTPIGNVEVTPDTKVEADTTVQTPSAEQSVPDTEKAAVKIDVVAILFAVWLTGAVIYAAGSILSYAVYTRRVLKTSTPAESETMAIYESLCGKMNIKNRPRLLTSRVTDSPAAFGIFRKYIVLPELPLSLNSLELTLSHELTHVKRHDLILKLIVMAARSFHWFNPLVHYAARRCESECELSCDEAVLAGRDDEARTEYGETLVDILKFCRRRRGSLTTHFSPDKKAVKARLASILSGSGKKRGIVLVALCLALCIIAGAVIGFGFGTDVKVPAADTQTEETETDPVPDTESEPETDANETEPVPDTETVESDPAPEEVKSAFTVLPGSSENVALYENVTYYDAYTGSHILCVLLVAECDVENFSVTKLTWSEELLVESEEIIHTIGGIKAGDAVMLNVDPVEIVGYTGISYEVDGEVHRAFPAVSGMDGSPLLMDIKKHLSIDIVYPGLPKFEVTISEEYPISDALKALYDYSDNESFWHIEEKALTVHGLSVPVYLKFGEGFKLSSATVFGNTVKMSKDWSYDSSQAYGLWEYDGAVFLSYNNYDVHENTAVFTDTEAKNFDSGTEGISTMFEKNADGSLDYTRIAVKFQKNLYRTATAPLDHATSRDDFYREVGKAYIENDRLVMATPHVSETISDVFDLDKIFVEYPLVYTGYTSVEEVLADNAMGTVTAEKLVVPDESFKGEWNHNTGRYYDDSITLTVIQRDKIQFHVNSLNYSATAVLIDGMWLFGHDVYPVYKQDTNIGGMLEFTADSVTVRYGEFGKLSDTYSHMNAVQYTRTFTHHKTNLSRSYSDRIYSCDVAEMPRRVLGHYTVKFNNWNSDYVLKTTVTVCNGGCENYDPFLYNNEVLSAEYGTEDGWEYPVKVYTRSLENADPDGNPKQYTILKRFSHYIFDMGNGMHYELEFNAASYDTTPLENEQEILDELAKSARLEYNIPGHMSKPVGNVTVDVRKNTYIWINDELLGETYTVSYDYYPNIETSKVTYTTNPDYKTEAFMTKNVEGKFDPAELVRRSTAVVDSITDFKVTEKLASPVGYQGAHSVTVLQADIQDEMYRDLESRSEYYTIEHLQRRYYYVINYGTEGEYLILSIVPTDIDIVPTENDKAAADAIARSAYVTE